MKDSFLQNGFEIVQADDLSRLVEFQLLVRDFAYKIINKPPQEVSHDINFLHEAFKSSEEANTFRLKLTAQISDKIDCGSRVFEIFQSNLEPLVGVDVLAQKTPNVVFQPPGYPVPTELHRDAPANSPYEVIVWLPFVDCFDTKSMYLLNRKYSEKAADFVHLKPKDKTGFDEILLEHAELMEVPFGSALIFWSGLFHGSIVNKESESRLSINIRFKNLFSPLGHKDPLRYFQILRTSPLTKLGLNFQLKEQTN